MPSKGKIVDRDVAKLPSIPKELVDLFLTGPMTGEAVNAAGIAFKKALIEATASMVCPRLRSAGPASCWITNWNSGAIARSA